MGWLVFWNYNLTWGILTSSFNEWLWHESLKPFSLKFSDFSAKSEALTTSSPHTAQR